ncbi:MAG: aspartyl protease family protein [Acetobacteraceae bacterium]|nr:aspartyl protease family protein [Acetobacteraceae bacterium]
MLRAGLLLILLIVLLTGPALACQVERRADVPASLADGFVEVPATVDGKPARFLLDTGAEDMLVTPGAAARLALAPDPAHMTRLLGTGGEGRAANVWLAGLRVGDATLARRSVPVVPLPPPLAADGLLGAPLLTDYDLDLDLVNGHVGLFHVEGCAAGAPLLPPPFTVVPLTLNADGVPSIPVVVNGVRLTALLDTGSRATALTPATAARVRAVRLREGGTARGVDGEVVAIHAARLATLAVGWDVQHDVQVAVAPLQIGHADMLLGVDWLRQRRVWVSYATRRVLTALAYAWR